MKYTEKAIVLECDEIGTRIFSLRLRTEHIAAAALPGQFVSVYANDSARLLPRPISICEADPKSGVLRLVFRIAGQGTKEFSQLKPGESVKITGPLGTASLWMRPEESVYLPSGAVSGFRRCWSFRNDLPKTGRT